MEPSQEVDTAVRERASKLDKFYDRIMGCRVLVESPHHHRRHGRLYHVRIDLTVPGGEIVVKRDPAQHAPHKDVLLAIHDAFDEARRQLEDFARRQREWDKARAQAPMVRCLDCSETRVMGFFTRRMEERSTSTETAC